LSKGKKEKKRKRKEKERKENKKKVPQYIIFKSNSKLSVYLRRTRKPCLNNDLNDLKCSLSVPPIKSIYS